MSSFVKDTILAILATLGLICLGITLWYDYYLSVSGQPTISHWFKELRYRRLNQPEFWFVFGFCIASPIIFIVGFIAGHLLWPQYL